MLVVVFGVAGFCARVDAVKKLRLLVKVVAVGLKVLVPVGELDDDFYLGIDGARGAENEFARDVIHELEAECVPRLVGFCGDVGVVLGVVEEKVVKDNFVEMARGDLSDVFDVVALFGVGVAHGDELAAGVIGCIGARGIAPAYVGYAARRLDMVGGEERLDLLEIGVVGDGSAAIGFDVDFVDFDLAGEVIPRLFKVCGVLHLLDDKNGDIDGDAKLVVIWRWCGKKGTGR